MPPKKGKKQKKDKGGKSPKVKEEEYRLITAEEFRQREQQNHALIAEVKACRALLQEALIDAEISEAKRRKLEKWKAYLRCDGIPKPYLPPEVRRYFSKIKFFDDIDVEKSIDWLLSVDERSLLNQDIHRTDKSRRFLVNTIRPNYGSYYEYHIHRSLQILKSIEYYLDNPKLTQIASERILNEIKELKTEVQQEIADLFDRFTYRIISLEDAYMDTVDAKTSEYFYTAEDYEIHLWTLKNVPIRFNHMSDPTITANLHLLKTRIQLPYSTLEDNLTIRGLHLKFDHLSEHAKSYAQLAGDFDDVLSDLFYALIREWHMQMVIQDEIRNKLIQKRADYEEKLAAAELEKKNKKKDAKDKKGKGAKKDKKNPKKTKEPQIITADTFVDVYDEFLKREQDQFEELRNIIYHPDVLDLYSTEINLKKYIILGGVYKFYFVTKPQSYEFDTYNMAWHENDRKLDEHKMEPVEMNDYYRSSKSSLRYQSVRYSRVSLNRLSIKIDRYSDDDISLDTSQYIIKFFLPHQLCLWGEPVACHFEADVVGIIKKIVEPEPEILSHFRKRRRTSLLQSRVSMRSVSSMSGIRKGSRLSRRSSAVDVSEPRLTVDQMILHFDSYIHEPEIPLKTETNFYLDQPLTKDNIEKLVRYCLPRILSSYTFPKELMENNKEDEENTNKPLALRARVSFSQEQEGEEERPPHERFDTDIDFAYNEFEQTAPERLFPRFSIEEEVRKLDYYSFLDSYIKTYNPETFYELVDILNSLKFQYKINHKDILNVPDFKLKINIAKEISALKKKPTTEDDEDDEYVASGKSALLLEGVDSIEMDAAAQASEFSDRGSTFSHGGESISSTRRTKSERKSKRSRVYSRTQSVISTNLTEPERKESIMTTATARASSIKEERETRFQEDLLVNQEEAIPEEDEEDEEEEEEGLPEEEDETFKYSHWTTEYISKTEYDKENKCITIYTDRLGTFGFAYKLYEHFPFRSWTLEPNDDNPETELLLTLETQHVTCYINISTDGYKGYVMDTPKGGFIAKPVTYLEIPEPITDLKEMKKRFRESNINIFANSDASFYIDNDYFSEKHLGTEIHTYNCMALYCNLVKFSSSIWNRLAQRRDIILRFSAPKETEENINTCHIKPEVATFVEINELCSDNVEKIFLEYIPTWRNIDDYVDLSQLIVSVFPSAMDLRVKDPNLICNLRDLLAEIRFLSYS